MGIGVRPTPASFLAKTRLFTCARLRARPASPFGRGRNWKGWQSQFRSVAKEWKRFGAGTLKSASLQCKLGTRKCYAFLAFFAKQKATHNTINTAQQKIHGILLDIRTLIYSHSPHNSQAINELAKMIVGGDIGD